MAVYNCAMSEIVGRRFGRLVVLRLGVPVKTASTCIVQCDCGSPEKTVFRTCLVSGATRSCGCISKAKDISGQRFGLLVVLRMSERVKGGTACIVQCDCGSPEKVVYKGSLVSGSTRSCGCRNRLEDLIGQRFGRLVVLRQEKTVDGKNTCVVQCDCGSPEKVLRRGDLLSGHTKSCGCLYNETRRPVVHGHTAHGENSPEHNTWCRMRSRCFNEDDPKYPDYGGRGITICERWSRFENFFADMGPRPSLKHSVERKEVNGNYEPGNCIWAINLIQARNKRETHRVTWRGETLALADWAERVDVPYLKLHRRLLRKWSLDKAFLTPADQRKPKLRRHYKPAEPGDVYEKWTVVSEAPRRKNKCRMLNVVCSCGSPGVVQESALRAGQTKECRGCWVKRGRLRDKTTTPPSQTPYRG